MIPLIARQIGARFATEVIKRMAMCLIGAMLVLSSCTASAGLVLVANHGQAPTAPSNPGGGFFIEPVQGPTFPAGLPNDIPLSPSTTSTGNVSDQQRYVLALMAWGNVENAIIATALSFAEDGSGNPRALSAKNFDESRDFCLWQVNSGWWARFGGMEALAVPENCARAAYVIFTLQGWCAWSTYEAACGRGHNSAYRAYLACARVLSVGQSCK